MKHHDTTITKWRPLIKGRRPSPPTTYRWRDAYGVYHRPSEMETRHLFFTLRMIWNHTAPPEARIEPYQRYEFRGHTKESLAEAILPLARELAIRDDLTPYFKRCLEHMASYSHKFPQITLPE